jgi:carbon monoxide dehydrogenase subunit G
MAQFSISKRIAAPVETVFDVATDLAHAAEHVRGIEKIELVTDGPIGVGTRWRETRKMMGGASTETFEIKAFDQPRSYTAGCESCGAYFETKLRFDPDGDATNLTLDVRMEARTLMAKLMSPLGNLMFGNVMRKAMNDDLDDLKRVAEQIVPA